MTYRIQGVPPDTFASLRGLSEAALAKRNARCVTAAARPGFPCRVTLEDVEPGEPLILLNHVSHDVPTPYRTAYTEIHAHNAAHGCFLARIERN